jgi:hypothetical protein
MKKWMIAILAGGWGFLMASVNPFDPSKDVRMVDRDVDMLLSELKSVKIETPDIDDELDSDDTEETEKSIETSSEPSISVVEQPSAVESSDEKKDEQSNNQTASSVADKKEIVDVEKQKVKEVVVVDQEEKRETHPEERNTSAYTQKATSVSSEAKPALEIGAGKTTKKEETVDIARLEVSPAPQKKTFANKEKKQSVTVSSEVVVKHETEAASSDKKAKADDVQALIAEQIRAVESDMPVIVEKKTSETLSEKKPKEESVTIASIMRRQHIEEDDGIADIDLEKEREEAARRAEEELRKAIAAVDQED